MGFKTGALVGFAVGYYLGAKAGRERYHQINDWLEQVRSSEAVTTVTDKAKSIVDEASDLTQDFSSN